MAVVPLRYKAGGAPTPWTDPLGTLFTKGKSIPITGTTPDECSNTINILITEDTLLKLADPTHNFGSHVNFVTNPTAAAMQRGLLRVDLTATLATLPAGYTIDSALLYLSYSSYVGTDPTSRHIEVYEMTQKNWVEGTGTGAAPSHDGACYNEYDANNITDWTGGHTGGDSDKANGPVSSDPQDLGAVGWKHWDITAIVAHCIASHANIVDLYIRDSDETGAGIYAAVFDSSETATPALKPYIALTYKWTPAVPNPYTVMVDLYRGSPSMEEDAVGWNINARGVFHTRYGIPVETFSALSSGQCFEVLVDTKSMVDAVDDLGVTKFFPDGAAANAKKVEFVLEVAGDKETNDCYYWCSCALGDPIGFNSGGTRFYVAAPVDMAANSEFTVWMYVDKTRCADGDSSNYSAADTGIFYTDFADAAANLAAFEIAYPLWSQDTVNAPTVVVAANVLTLTGNADATWRGIATDATIGTNFHARFRITAAPGAGFACGIVDAGGIGAAANKDGAYLFKNGADEFETSLDGVATGYSCAYPTAPFVVDICKYGAFYRYIMERNDPDYQPETYCLEYADPMRDIPATNVAHKLFIASKAATGGSVDSVFAYTEPEHPPTVKAPAVTYLRPGAVFCDNNSYVDPVTGQSHFPYDTALALEDGTVLYCGDDKLVQLTSEPGDTTQLAVRVPLDLSANQTIYCYVGHADITAAAPHDHWTNASAWDEYDNFAAVADWTEEIGTWALDDYIEPVISKAPVGNVGASPGRCWVRMPCFFSWNSRFYEICSTAMWEHGGYFWPLPYRNLIQEAAGPGQPFGVPVMIMEDEEFQGLVQGGWIESVYVDGVYPGGTIYASVSSASTNHKGGFKIWKCTAADPMDPDNWSLVTGVLLDLDWTTAHGIAAATSVLSYHLYKSGATWYIILAGVDSDAGAFYEAHTAEAPTHPWTNVDFSDWVEFYDTGVAVHCEDIDFAHDAANNITYMYYTRASSPFIHYAYLDEDVSVFPGVGSWNGNHELTFDKPSWATGNYGSPRVFDNIATDGFLYLYAHGKPEDETADYFHKWCPDWVFCDRGNNFVTFSEFNVKSKYKQTNAAVFARAYKTGTSYSDISIVCEVQVTARMGGVIYRNDDANNNGYFALIDYNVAGTSYVRLYRYTAGGMTEIGAAYTIPAWPEPGACGYFHLNTPWRIRLDVVGASHKVYVSRWGSPWQLCKTATEGTYYQAATVGAGFYLSGGAINEWKVRKIVSPEPQVGSYADLSRRSGGSNVQKLLAAGVI